ncbi:hypothetical protein [Mycoplasma sp. OR1901]|uniref:hypothetical protein n=1 Tax=Mycoplasma sp. OR1901 TaxID=2742195 RepID=UPI001584061D|nr:hypothetical protein [Mycoplasma sp. OR1901]QKT05683.1 hypothetical protein HTZ87_03165 [Mycoplasma sp. OR1901]
MYQKYKTNINKQQFYIFISLIALLSVALLIWVLIPFGYGINEEFVKKIESKNNEEEISKLVSQLAMKTIISYIANSFVIVFFLVYILLLKNKIKAGYLFFIIWILVFITFVGMPFYGGSAQTSQYTKFQFWVGIFASFLSGVMAMTLFVFMLKYHIDRKFHYYEWYKIHKGRSR